MTPIPGGSSWTRTTSPTPSTVSMSSMMTVKWRFTFVPTASGVFERMNTPEREMFVTYSLMNASYDSNSLLIVTRSSLRADDSAEGGGGVGGEDDPCIETSPALQIELLEVVLLARHE